MVSFAWLALAVARVCSVFAVAHSGSKPQVHLSAIFELPSPLSAENLIQRSNGQVLISTQGGPYIYQVDPLGQMPASVLHNFVGHENMFGMVELGHDVFYAIAGNYTGAPTWKGTPNSNAVYRIAFLHGSHNATVSKLVDIPAALTLDGLAVVNKDQGLLVTGDTQTGILYLVNAREATAHAIFQSPLLNQTAATPAELSHVGINGLWFYQGDLFFSNTARAFVGKIALWPNGSVAGDVVSLAQTPLPDDLTVTDGNIIATELEYGLVRVDLTKPGTAPELLASFPGANSCRWGRAEADDYCALYAVFNRQVINGTGSGLAVADMRGQGLRCGC